VNVKCGQQINAEKAEDSQPGQDKQAKYIWRALCVLNSPIKALSSVIQIDFYFHGKITSALQNFSIKYLLDNQVCPLDVHSIKIFNKKIPQLTLVFLYQVMLLLGFSHYVLLALCVQYVLND
jgi:hypothetical protein